MKFDDLLEIYVCLAEVSAHLAAPHDSIQEQRQIIAMRQKHLQSCHDSSLVKVAFDTRRINQETDYNPRRGLQNYHRADQFVSQIQAQKIGNFSKLRDVLNKLKDQFGHDPEWQNSYCRILLNTLNQSLRIVQGDGDFGDTQPAIGSFDYVEELLYVRYRLDINSINKLGEEELRNIILNKDENLIHKGPINNLITTSSSVKNIGDHYNLIKDLIGEVRASKDQPVIERTITISVKDSIKEG